MKRKLISLVVLGLLTLPVTQACADGMEMFLQKCGACHKSGGQAASVNPADKAGIVWQKYFKRGRHRVDMGIDDATLSSVIAYLVDHAADSDQPASAVIPK